MATKVFSKFIFLTILHLVFVLNGKSQSCCSGGVPLSSSIGIAPEAPGVFQTLLITDVNYLSTFKRGTQKLEDSFRKRRTTSIIVLNSYSFTNRFSADLTVSWVEQFRRVEGFANSVNTEKSSGLGDVVFLAKYKLSSPLNEISTLLFGVGVKFPTADTSQKNENGIVMNLDMQPGSGSFDGLFWTHYSRNITNWRTASIFSSNLLQLTGHFNEFNQIQQYKVGNNLVSRLGITNQLSWSNKLFDTILEVIYRKNWKDKVDNQLLPNTGGQWVFFKPGLSWTPNQRITLNVGLELPLFAQVVGEQLSSTSRISMQLIFRSDRRPDPFKGL